MRNTTIAVDPGAEDWRSDLNSVILDFRARGGPMAPVEIGRQLHLSEGAVSSFLAMLAQEGKIGIRLVELTGGPS